MSVFSGIGSFAKKAAHVLSPITNVPALGRWLGAKPEGAQNVNNYAENKLGIGRAKVGAPGIPDANDPLDAFIRNQSSGGGDTPLNSFIKNQSGSVDRSRLGTIQNRADNDYNAARGNYASFADNGGWDDSQISSMDENIGRLKNIGQHGARDEAEANRVRGNGVFDEFAQTGGLSADDAANMRSRGNSVGKSLFSGISDRMGRQAITQGRGAGYDAQMAKISRDSARQADDASRDTELGITDTRNKGRQWGAESLSDAEKSLISNMLGGNSSAGNMEQSMVDSIKQGKQFGTAGLESLYHSPGADLGYEQMYNQADQAKTSQYLQAMGMDQNRIDQYLRALGMKNDQETNYLNILSGRNPNVSNFDKYGQPILNAAIAGGSTALTGPKR